MPANIYDDPSYSEPTPTPESIPHEAHLRSFIEETSAGVKPVDAKVSYPSSDVAGLKTSVDEIIKALKESGLLTS